MTRSNADEFLRVTSNLRGADKKTAAVWRDGAHRVGREVVRQASSTSWRFTNRDGSKVKLEAKYRVSRDRAGFATWTVGSPPGPWVLFQRGSHKAPNGWTIRSKITRERAKGRGSTRINRQRDLDIAFGAAGIYRGAKPLRTPYGPKFTVRHPHLPPSFRWTQAKARATPRVSLIVQQSSGRAFTRIVQGR